MKQVFFTAALLVILASLNNGYAQGKAAAAYKAQYSSNFKIGNNDYSMIVLNLWKDWDDNQLARHDYFADTLTMYLPDGTVVKGKAKCMESATAYRATMTSSVSTIHAYVPLYSNDTKDNVVCIWGTEVDTMTDGKVDTKELHEVWWFNKDGKLSMMRQWQAKFPQP